MMYRFADCVLDTERYALWRAGRLVRLRPKVFQVLTYLLAQHPRVVSKQELAEQIWPEQIVSETALEACIKAVRQVMGDSGRTQKIIQTRHGHGYCFVAPVTQGVSLRSRGIADAASPATGEDGAPDTAWHGVAPEVGERKVVTILCCALAPSPVANPPVALDALHRQMQVLYALVHDAVHAYGGCLQPPAGEHVLVVFGAPIAQEDHVQRALFSALALRQHWAAHQATPGASGGDARVVRMGVHTGTVAVGGIGQDAEPVLAMVGDTAPVAVALQEQAASGIILCSEAAAQAVRGGVHLQAVGPLRVAGHATPIQAYKVLQRRSRRAPGGLRRAWTRMPLVGREPELDTLQALWAQVEAGRGQVIGVVGEPGMGKSRLVQTFRRRLRGTRHTYLTGRCVSYGGTMPYLPIVDLLRHACGIIELDAPTVVVSKVRRCLDRVGLEGETAAPSLLHLLGLHPASDDLAAFDPDAYRARTFALLLQMSLQSSQRHPLVLEVEDVHWIDATSEAWLAALVDRLAHRAVLVLVTYRSGYSPPWLAKSHATQIALGRLTPRDSRRLLHAFFATRPQAETLVQELIVKADGNPFFLTELAQSITEQQAHQTPWVVPDTIQAVLTARIDRLSPTAKHVLQVAAVMGKEIRCTLLNVLTAFSEAELHRSLIELQTTEFLYETRLVPEPLYTFAHVLTQEAAYHSLLQHVRQHYHERIAQALVTHVPDTATLQPELLAHHYTEAGLSEPAMTWWHRAGQRALGRGACIEAVQHCTTGLGLLSTVRDTPQRLQLELDFLIIHGRALMEVKGFLSPEVERAYATLQERCRQVGGAAQLGVILRDLRIMYTTRGEWRKALQIGEQLFDLAQRAQDDHLLLVAHQALGMTLSYLGEVSTARMHLERAMALVDPLQPHSVSRALSCRSVVAPILWMLGYPAQALASTHEALIKTREQSFSHPPMLALFHAALVYQWRRESHVFHEITAELLSLATEWQLSRWVPFATVAQGWMLTECGKVDEGLMQMGQGIAAYGDIGARQSLPMSLAMLAEAYGKSGQPQKGLRALAEALTVVHNSGGYWYEAELHRLSGELWLAQESTRPAWRKAEACFQQALSIARRQQAKSLELRAARNLSRLWSQQGKTQEARHVLGMAYDWFTEGFDTADLQAAKALLETL